MGQIIYPYTAIWFHIFINKNTSFLFAIIFDVLIMCNPKGLITLGRKTRKYPGLTLRAVMLLKFHFENYGQFLPKFLPWISETPEHLKPG